MSTKNIIICIDGAVEDRVCPFDIHKRLNNLGIKTIIPLQRLKSVDPSSTAPAHASAFTGLFPVEHTIMGNRYFPPNYGDDYDPVKAIGPYTRSTHPATILDTIENNGLKWSAVNMPQTLDSGQTNSARLSLYVLYGPSQSIIYRLEEEFCSEQTTFRIFSREIKLCFNQNDGIWILCSETSKTRFLNKLGWQRVILPDFDRIYDFWIQVQRVFGGWKLFTSKIGIVIGSPNLSIIEYIANQIDCPVEYEHRYINLGVKFQECPSEKWVTQAAIEAAKLEDPDVMFVRYNTVDHAQEQLLYRSGPSSSVNEELGVSQAYRQTIDEIEKLVCGFPQLETVTIFSDHGITSIDKTVSLTEIERIVFQGTPTPPIEYLDTRVVTFRVSSLDYNGKFARKNGFPDPIERVDVHSVKADNYKQDYSRISIWVRSDYEILISDGETRGRSWAGHGGEASIPELQGILYVGSKKSNSLPAVKGLHELKGLWESVILGSSW